MAVAQVRAEAEPPITEMGLDKESGAEAVREVVAVVPKSAGVAVVVVQ